MSENVFDNIRSFQTLTIGLLKGLRENIDDNDLDIEKDSSICDTAISHIEILFQWGTNLYQTTETNTKTIQKLVTGLAAVLILDKTGGRLDAFSEETTTDLMHAILDWASGDGGMSLEGSEIKDGLNDLFERTESILEE